MDIHHIRRARAADRRAAMLLGALLTAACGGGSDYAVEVAPRSLTFAAEQLGPRPPSQALEATYRGDGLLVGYPPDVPVPGWLEVVKVGGDATRASLSVGVTTTSLPPGIHTTTLRFVTGKADGSKIAIRDVPVSYQVGAPAFTVTGARQATITEGARWADLALPMAVATGMGAAEGAACRWEVTSSQPFASVSPASGTLAADTPLLVNLDPDALWALPNGTHTTLLSFRLGAGCSRTGALQVLVSVSLALRPALSAAPVTFSVTDRSTPPDYTRSVSVVSNLGEAFAGHGGWSASLTDTWATVSPSGGQGSGAISLDLHWPVVAGLAAGSYAAALDIRPAEVRVPRLSVPVTLSVVISILEHVAPATTWVGRPSPITIRGSGFAGTATLPILVGTEEVTATVVSDTELRATIPPKSEPVRLPVRLPNALGLDRGGSELVVLPAPGYTADSRQLAKHHVEMTLDPERQAVLLTGWAQGEVLRLSFKGGAWAEEHVTLANADGTAVTLDGREVLVFSGDPNGGVPLAMVRLDAGTLATKETISINALYEAYTLIAPLADGRTMLINSSQSLDTRWFPSQNAGPRPLISNALMRRARDGSRIVIRPAWIDPSAYNHTFFTFDAGDTAFRSRFKPKSFNGRDWDLSQDGGRMLDGIDLYDRAFVKLGSLVLPDPPPEAAALSPDGASAFTFSRVAGAWVLRRTDLRAAAGPYPADATPLPLVLPASQFPLLVKVSEDGSTLFVLASNSGGTGSYFHAVPLP